MDDKEAKETLKTMKENIDKKYLKTRNSVAIETLLNLLENQKAEIEAKDKSLKLHTKLEYQYKNDYLNAIEELKKKDKIIDEMAEKLKQLREASLEDCFIPRSYRDIDDCLKTTCEECIKQYFENKVKESK